MRRQPTRDGRPVHGRRARTRSRSSTPPRCSGPPRRRASWPRCPATRWTRARPGGPSRTEVRRGRHRESGREEVEFAPAAVPPACCSKAPIRSRPPPGRTYPAGRIRRFFAGDLNRHLWSVPVRLPGARSGDGRRRLQPDRATGGKQTVGLRLPGRQWPGVRVPPGGEERGGRAAALDAGSGVRRALDDQMAAQFPFGAVVVSGAAGRGRDRRAPADAGGDAQRSRLGQYRAVFAGRVGLLSVHPDEREGRPPRLRRLPTDRRQRRGVTTRCEPIRQSSFDDRYYLRIRLIDMLVGDWDRHRGQWRWGRAVEGKPSGAPSPKTGTGPLRGWTERSGNRAPGCSPSMSDSPRSSRR